MNEIALFGVYLSPLVGDLALAALAFAPVKLALDRTPIDRLVWHRPLFDVALFVCILALVTFTVRPMGAA